MELLISATNALNKWMKLDLPRIPSQDGKRIGTQTLHSDANSLAWQCHVLTNSHDSHRGTVIAVEAYSRYVIIMPNLQPLSKDEFAEELLTRFGNEVIHHMLAAEAISEEQVPEVMAQYMSTPKVFSWVRNTDLSVNGHVGDAEKWVRQSTERSNVSNYSKENAISLGIHINQMKKCVTLPNKKRVKFYPVSRIVDDGLFRFAKGLSADRYYHTKPGDFPNPYDIEHIEPHTKQVQTTTTNNKDIPEQLPDNVVSLAQFRAKKQSKK